MVHKWLVKFIPCITSHAASSLLSITVGVNNSMIVTSSFTNQFHYSYWFVSAPAFAWAWSIAAACARLSGRQAEAENVAYGAEAHGGSELGNQGHSNVVVPLRHLLGPRNKENHIWWQNYLIVQKCKHHYFKTHLAYTVLLYYKYDIIKIHWHWLLIP